MAFPGGSVVKNLPAMQELQEMQICSPGWEDALEEGVATPPPPFVQRFVVQTVNSRSQDWSLGLS